MAASRSSSCYGFIKDISLFVWEEVLDETAVTTGDEILSAKHRIVGKIGKTPSAQLTELPFSQDFTSNTSAKPGKGSSY